jgi:predicted Zn-dependent protease
MASAVFGRTQVSEVGIFRHMAHLAWFGQLIPLAGISLLCATAAFGQATTNRYSFQEYLLVPLRVHLLSAKETPAIQTTLAESDVTRILGKLNSIWSQAGLHFYVESLVREEANQPETYRSVLLGLRPSASLATNLFHVYYLKKLVMNGICFSEAIFVKDTASLRPVEGGLDEPIPRVTSHELGHALGLSHRQNTTNLMASGTTGFWLNDEEIKQARLVARKLHCIESAPELLKRADLLFRAKKMQEAAALYSGLATLPLRVKEVDLAKQRADRAIRFGPKSNMTGARQ